MKSIRRASEQKTQSAHRSLKTEYGEYPAYKGARAFIIQVFLTQVSQWRIYCLEMAVSEIRISLIYHEQKLTNSSYNY